MNSADMTRSLVEVAIDKALHDIARDPDRSIRNLVDLGSNFSNGRFQTGLFSGMQDILKNRSTRYYELARRIIADVKGAALKSFGLNLGYNAFTHGAKHIRDQEAELGFNIPWMIEITYRQGEALTEEDVCRVIDEGQALGIYTYFIHMQPGELPALDRWAHRYNDCAFVAFLTDPMAPEALLYTAENVMISLDVRSECFERCAGKLRADRALYAAHCRYDDGSADHLLSGEWADAVLAGRGTFFFLIAQPGTSQKTQERVYDYALSLRDGQQYPVFVMDYYRDMLYIDHVISEMPCFMGILEGGQIIGVPRDTPTGISIHDMPLIDILRKTMPRTN